MVCYRGEEMGCERPTETVFIYETSNARVARGLEKYSVQLTDAVTKIEGCATRLRIAAGRERHRFLSLAQFTS